MLGGMSSIQQNKNDDPFAGLTFTTSPTVNNFSSNQSHTPSNQFNNVAGHNNNIGPNPGGGSSSAFGFIAPSPAKQGHIPGPNNSTSNIATDSLINLQPSPDKT